LNKLKSERLKLMSEDFVVEIVEGVAIVRLNMLRATIKEAQEFKKTLQSIIQKGHDKIIVDFSQSNFVDSSILGVIVTMAKELRTKGGDIRGIIIEGSMLNMFAQTGLEKVFRYFPNQEFALSSFTT
jgi:anti-anti-sigma factor